MPLAKRLTWVAAGVAALSVIALVARSVQGGSLDPDGPPAPTGPIEALLAEPTPRAIAVAEDVVVANGQEVLLPWQDVRDCERVVAFAEASLINPNLQLGSAIVEFKFRSSLNAVDDFGAAGFSGQDVVLPLAPYDTAARSYETVIETSVNPRSAPYLGVIVSRVSSTGQPADANASIWLYCD